MVVGEKTDQKDGTYQLLSEDGKVIAYYAVKDGTVTDVVPVN